MSPLVRTLGSALAEGRTWAAGDDRGLDQRVEPRWAGGGDQPGHGATALGDHGLLPAVLDLIEPSAEVVAQLADTDLESLRFLWRFHDV